MDGLQERIDKERLDRVAYHDTLLNPIRKQVQDINEGMKKEKKDRIANEKKIVKQIQDQSARMQEDILKESISRKERMQDLEDFLDQDT